MQSLADILASYVRWTSSLDIEVLASTNDWPDEFAEIARRFVGYHWAKTLSPPDPHLYGICPLGFHWPRSLAGLERGIFEPCHLYDELRMSHHVNADQYLIIELRSPNVVIAHLAMQVEGGEWYLLDGHVICLQKSPQK